jgi:ATP-dependent exoDNAse (exonuclease V) beta subunit
MTVHRAKGLEFPVVILADITANIAAAHPSRHVDPERGLCALRLAGWSPWDLLDHEEEEVRRERAEGVRIAYVAATRARDLLVVPAVGDDPFAGSWEAAGQGWIVPVQKAMYPLPSARRASVKAPGYPAFGDDSVLERPDRDTPGTDNVRPGLHCFGASSDEEYAVAWWDPRCLALDVKPLFGLRRRELIEDPGGDVVEADRRRYDEWRAERQLVLERGARPSISVQSVTEWARRQTEGSDVTEPLTVDIVDAGQVGARPAGPRFGTLVHAVLAVIPLDATPATIGDTTGLQGRILGATPEEVSSAAVLVGAALAHPLMVRAREAWKLGGCRRETPVTCMDEDGSLVEGVLDLAFEEADGWTIVDFKTATQTHGALERYRRQIQLYSSVVAKATGRNTRGILMHL